MFSSGNPRVMTRDSINMRDLIESPWYRQTFGIRWELSEDANTKLLYKNSASGFRQALTAGQRTTGDRADGLFVDDPTDAADSNSIVALESAINWWDSAFGNRLNDLRTGSRCIIMQRLHENDLSGHLLRREPGQWEHLCLRMLYEIGQQPHTSLGNPDPRTTEGELMFPERFPQHIIESERLRLGSAGFAGQMQQRPASLEGEIFKRGHFGVYNPSELHPFFERRCQVWDTAFKAKEESDFSVGFELAKTHDGAIFVLRRARGRFPYPELKSIIRQWGTERPPHAVLIEDAASGQSVIQDLKASTRMPIVPVKPDGDKVARAHSIVPTYEAGVIYLPDGAPWVDEFLDELHAFPKAAHDDQVDAFVYGIRWLMAPRGGVSFGSVPRRDGAQW
jgi:predicted phage terminase large subunit-like protein